MPHFENRAEFLPQQGTAARLPGKVNQMFEGRVTETVIPYDPVFDLLVTERKILFLHYLTSRVTSYYVKLMHELFNLDEEKIWQVTLQQEKGRPTNKAVPCVL